ncbi:Zn(II)2Cys6 transcription factor [Aspergillus affinis]|uniref:Zn(II)2Cys6 transcription factor n=1 Tax=Aspergillus affinis TaxID=1070780 RepID=UPI0022FE5E11|nr:uncharacterized protein KD926_007396 [Aspergillus affinis]KAI9041126.1 hypothetical protein KD926_007396 [Aspergillus affinis]
MIRPNGARSKTGCKTCRIRRVKCDEARPVCNRCSSTGRKCDGYVVCSAGHAKRPLIPRAYSSPAPCAAVGCFPRLSHAEAQGFVYFRDHTSREATGWFVSAIWKQMILPMAHREAAVMHAAVGVGAMHRSTRGQSPSLRLPACMESHHSFALSQYVKAIRQLRERLDRFEHDRQNPEIALVACLLFVCLEMLQGNRLGVLLHLQNGLRVLASIPSQVRRVSNGEHRCLLVTRERPTGVEQITEILVRLDVDSTAFGERAPAYRIASALDALGPERPLPPKFIDLVEARHFIDCLTSTAHHIRGDLLALSREFCRDPPRDAAWRCCMEFASIRMVRQSQHAALFANMKTLEKNLAHWLASFQHLTPNSPEDAQSSMFLEIRFHSVFLQLTTCHNDRETYCDQFAPTFHRIVDLCSLLIGDAVHSTGPTFVVDSGLIPSLYLTAIKCRRSEIRRRAISLLSRYPCQEGMWEPALMGHFVHEVSRLEEVAARSATRQEHSTRLTFEDVPEAARFCVVIMAVTERVGEGRLVCARYMHETTGELEITEHLIPIALTE